MTRTNRLFTYTASTLMLMFALVLLGTGRAAAEGQTVPQLGIRPIDSAGTYFDLTLEPGTMRELTVELGNYGSSPVQVRTYVANVNSLVNGGMSVGAEGDTTSGMTAWITYPSEVFRLEARSAQRRSFVLRVPLDTSPGEYMASIVLQSDKGTPASGVGGLSLSQVVRHAITVSVTVLGAQRPALTIGTVTHSIVGDKSVIHVSLHNTGNVRLQPTGNLVLTDAAGKEVSRFPVSMGTIYAGTTTSFEVPFAGMLNLGDYTIALDLSDAKSGPLAQAPALPLQIVAPATPVMPTDFAATAGPQVARINQAPSSPQVVPSPALTPFLGIAITPDVLLVGLAFLILMAFLPMLRRRWR